MGIKNGTNSEKLRDEGHDREDGKPEIQHSQSTAGHAREWWTPDAGRSDNTPSITPSSLLQAVACSEGGELSALRLLAGQPVPPRLRESVSVNPSLGSTLVGPGLTHPLWGETVHTVAVRRVISDFCRDEMPHTSDQIRGRLYQLALHLPDSAGYPRGRLVEEGDASEEEETDARGG